MKRREFIKNSSMAAAGLAVVPGISMRDPRLVSRQICVFSKCLQFLDYDQLGETIAKIGFDGADLTVRRGGHVSPENVEKDLPRAVKSLEKAGVKIPMITTSIGDPDNDITERILGTASDLGINYYRMGWYKYDDSKSIIQNLDDDKKAFEGLERLNRKYKIHGD